MEFDAAKNSPGRRNVVPYTSSAVVQFRSDLTAVRIPYKTKGSDWVQWIAL